MQTLKGKVIGNHSKETIQVLIEYTRPHRLYKKLVKKSTKFQVHNPGMEVALGDFVVIQSCRPISKNKYFMLKEIVGKVQTEKIESEKKVEKETEKAESKSEKTKDESKKTTKKTVVAKSKNKK